MYRLLTSLALFLCLAHTGNAQLSADFTLGKLGGCSPLVVSFQATTNSPNASFTWDLGNGNSATTANPQAIFTTIGSYTVTLTVSAGGQTMSASHVVTVYAPPTVSFTASSNLVCSTPVNFSGVGQAADGSSLTGWLWDFGDGSSQQTTATPTHTFSGQGLFTVSLTVSDDHGCTAIVLQPNLIKVLPPLTAGFGSDKSVV